MRRLPPPLSVTLPPPSSTIARAVRIFDLRGPCHGDGHRRRAAVELDDPARRDRLTTAADVQLAARAGADQPARFAGVLGVRVGRHGGLAVRVAGLAAGSAAAALLVGVADGVALDGRRPAGRRAAGRAAPRRRGRG